MRVLVRECQQGERLAQAKHAGEQGEQSAEQGRARVAEVKEDTWRPHHLRRERRRLQFVQRHDPARPVAMSERTLVEETRAAVIVRFEGSTCARRVATSMAGSGYAALRAKSGGLGRGVAADAKLRGRYATGALRPSTRLQ